MSKKDDIREEVEKGGVLPAKPIEPVEISKADFKEYKKKTHTNGMQSSRKKIKDRNLLSKKPEKSKKSGRFVTTDEMELRITADYALTGSYSETGKRYCKVPATVRSIVERNPMAYQHFEKLVRKKVSKSFRNLISLSTQTLEDRLIEDPDSFKPLELNAIFGTAYEKLRAELNLPDKIVKVEGEDGMRNLINDIDKELRIYEQQDEDSQNSSSTTSTA